METTENKQPRKIGLGLILGWGFGIILIAAGVIEIVSANPVEGIFAFLAGVVIFPPFWDFMKGKFNFDLSVTLKVILFLILIGIGGAQTRKSMSNSVPASPDRPNTVQTNTQYSPTATSVPLPTQAPQVLLDIKGSGSKSTQKFTAGGDWDLDWTYDCSNFYGGTGNFSVLIYTGNGAPSFQNSMVNQLGSKGADTNHYHVGGTYYLQISSECNWTIKVRG